MNEELMRTLFDDYKETKRHAVREHDGEIPMFLYISNVSWNDADDEEGVVGVIPIGGTIDDVAQVLAATMARAFIPYWAAILSDGYTISHDKLPPNHAGGLEPLFRAGYPGVHECLTITAASHDGEIYADSVTYWFDSDGDIWYNDVDGPLSKDTTAGPMIDVLKDVTSLWGMSHAEIISEIMKRTPDVN